MQLRVRKHSGRLIGPIEVSEFYKLYDSGMINDLDQCQVYPDGSWRNVEEYKNLDDGSDKKVKNIFSQLRSTHEVVPETLEMENVQVMDISQIRKKAENQNQTSTLQQIQREDAKDELAHELDSVDKKLASTEHKLDSTDIIKTKPEEIPDTSELTRTVVHSGQIEEDNSDKTFVNVDTTKYLEELKREQEIESKNDAIAAKVRAIEEGKLQDEENLTSDATKVINLSDLHEEIHENIDLNQVEKEMMREEQISEVDRVDALTALDEEDDDYEYDDDEDEEEEELKTKKKKKRIYLIFAVIVLYLFLADEEGAKNKKSKIVEISPVKPTIEYPIENEVSNNKKSLKFYNAGMIEYQKFTYRSLVKASKLFLKSLENRRENNDAIYPLIVSYAYILENSTKKHKDANTLFKLLRLVRTKVYLKQDVALAFALFYKNIGKPRAALNVLEKYRKVRSYDPDEEDQTGEIKDDKKDLKKTKKENLSDIFFYLTTDLQVSLEEYDGIKKFYKIYTPNAAARGNLLSSFIDYDLSQGNIKKAKKLIKKAVKLNPNSSVMLLYKAELLHNEEEYKEMKVLLDKVKSFNAGDSNKLYDKYLFLLGLYHFKTQKFKLASKNFRKVFREAENYKYREVISNLSTEGAGEEFKSVVNESLAEVYIEQTKVAMDELNWDDALTYAINASDLLHSYIPAKINLAKVQIKQGFFKKALDLLLTFSKEFQDDKRVVFNLIDAYIESYKLFNAKQVLLNAANGPLRDDPTYDKLSAKLSLRQGDKLQAVRWLQESMNSNPIDDENYYNLATLLIRLNKFKKAKAIISNAIDLAPDKIKYRLAYAEIIYEQNDPDTAVGYLRQQLDEFKNSPEILGEIAIYYHRSGQIKNFEESIKSLEKKFTRADKLYNFLIKSALLDHRQDDVVKYTKRLIKITPGSLKTRMLLVETLIELKRYQEAFDELGAIKKRLPDYPKLLYYESTINLVQGNVAKAKELAQKEVKKNPGLVHGYLLLGNILKTEGEYFKAEDNYKQAQKLLPNSSEAIAGMAYINFKKHQLEAAIDLYNKAIELDTSNPELRRELGDVYRQNGQNIDAMTQYKIYLELEPDSKYKLEINTYIRQFK